MLSFRRPNSFPDNCRATLRSFKASQTPASEVGSFYFLVPFEVRGLGFLFSSTLFMF